MNYQEKQLPMLPLRGILVFPYMVIHLDVGREKSIQAIEEAMANASHIFLASQKEAQTDDPKEEDIYNMGTVAEIKQLLKLPGGTIRILVEGISRGEIIKYESTDPYFRVLLKQFDENFVKNNESEALMRNLIYQFEQYVKLSKRISPETVVSVVNVEEPGKLADVIASHLSLRIEEKQNILNKVEIISRLENMGAILAKELEIVELERKINIRVRKQMEKNQKEYYLREQMKAIQKELGDKEDRVAEGEELRNLINKAKLPKEIEARLIKEVERLEKMPPMVAEAAVVRNYLDWALALPWSKSTKDRIDVKIAKQVLDQDHYGLRKPKERIIEYLAIRKLAKKMKGPILCLVGPPGVGKTSLGRSIAKTLDRKFVRMSLGGVRDEAEIRGHRRTYVGAMPGRIIQGMKQAGSRNPVFLLDEIDKMSADFRGDPSSALLEVLDPEQNNTFSDHYIEMPFDLSNVMFITTANNMYNIPRPLLDRMEVIHLDGYTEGEKVQIGMHHLLPKQTKEHALPDTLISLNENTMRKMIQDYTRESGVRSLERIIATLCRKIATQFIIEEDLKVRVTTQNVRKLLGLPHYHYNLADKNDEVGVATGMAWTEVGGDTLSIEVTTYRGHGKLTLTGKLGDVMKESAQTAFSYVRSKAEELEIEDDFFEKNDVHIHVPEGAIPKDGPSAGITMATAIASAITGRKVRCDLSMTGEITLRGKVLPIGGLKEKVLAAKRAGIKTVVLPTKNKDDMGEIPGSVKGKMEFKFVEHVDEVLKIALRPKEKLTIGKEKIEDLEIEFEHHQSEEIQQEGTIIPS